MVLRTCLKVAQILPLPVVCHGSCVGFQSHGAGLDITEKVSLWLAVISVLIASKIVSIIKSADDDTDKAAELATVKL